MNTEAKSRNTNSTNISAQEERIGSQIFDEHQEVLILTEHAKVRMKQRGIKSHWVELVLQYGREVYQKGKHTYSISLDKLSIKKIKKIYGSVEDLNKLRSMYVIVADDGAIVTCAYR